MVEKIKNSIIFYYPSKIVGGAEFLFVRLARFLAEDLNNTIYYVDYTEGFARKELAETKVIFLDYVDDIRTSIDFEGTLVTPLSNFYRITDYLDIKTDHLKMMFWCLHPYNIIHALPIFGKIERFSMKFIKILLKYFYRKNYTIFKTILTEFNNLDSINFMDCMNLNFNEYVFEIQFNKLYLPIFTTTKKIQATSALVGKNEINIAVLGRLCKDKVYPLLNILDNLSFQNFEKKVNFHIIGQGDDRYLIDETKYTEKINMIWVGTLINDELYEYLTTKADLLFAMGTSALDGASLALPTILLDLSTVEMHHNKFKWIFDSFDFCVGFKHPEYQETNKESFESIIHSIYRDNQKSNISLKCFEYFNSNHSLAFVAQNFKARIQATKLDYASYKKIKSQHKPIKHRSNVVLKCFFALTKPLQKGK
jgi:hypothetical protein